MKLYTKKICPKCLWAKEEINDLGLSVTEINIDENDTAKAFLISQNIMAVPVLEVDGELITDTTAIIKKLNELAK